MEISAQSLTSLFLGLKKIFQDALAQMAVPEVSRLVFEDDNISSTDRYPIGGLLGDLEEQLDELHMIDMWRMFVDAAARIFSAGLAIPRLHVENDQLGAYKQNVGELTVLGATHPARQIAALLMNGFATAFLPDGANIFSNGHAWVGGGAWDNLEHLPLTVANFDIACQHLEMRQGPNGQPLGLVPRVLVVGPLNRANAENILNVQMIGGTTNRQYKRCDLLVLPRITNLNWFVIDDERKPIVQDNQAGLEFSYQIAGDADSVFERDEYRYKVRRVYTLVILQPWRIQASDWEEGDTTTTAA